MSTDSKKFISHLNRTLDIMMILKEESFDIYISLYFVKIWKQIKCFSFLQ